MRRVLHSRATLILFVSMITITLVAMTASITLAAMQVYDYGQNTVRIASVGEVACTTSVSANVYPGGTSDATVLFSLAKGDYQVSKVSLSNFTLTSFTLNWGSNKSQTFNSVTTSGNTNTVATTAGNWVFSMNFGADPTVTNGTNKSTTLSITAPLGADSSDQNFGGDPAKGYMVGTITSIVCNFTVLVDPVQY